MEIIPLIPELSSLNRSESKILARVKMNFTRNCHAHWRINSHFTHTEGDTYSNSKLFKRYCVLFQLGEVAVFLLSNSLDE